MGNFVLDGVSALLLVGAVAGVASCGAQFTVQEEGGGGAGGATTSSVGGAAPGAGGNGPVGNGGSDPGDACPNNGVGWFTDDFENGQLEPEWGIDGDDIAGERNGYLFIGLNGEANSVATVFSQQHFTLEGCSVVAEVHQAPICGECSASFSVADANNHDNSLDVVRKGETLFFEEHNGGSTTTSETVPAGNGPEFWRIRERKGLVAFATSPDGQQWTTHHTVTVPAWVGDIRVEFSAEGRTSGNLAELQVESLNMAP